MTAVALGLTGCAQEPADLYSGEQGEADVLPDSIDAGARGWDADSSRLLATHDGTEFYVVAGAEGDCLITYAPDAPENWIAGCTPGGRVGTSGQLGIEADFAPAGLPGEAPEGWVRLTPELQITER
ncbi:hypothetical protein ACH9D2_11300 [Kocuria sp. M4R2S49]